MSKNATVRTQSGLAAPAWLENAHKFTVPVDPDNKSAGQQIAIGTHLITPVLASELLTLNTQNRNLRDRLAGRYARAMKELRFVFNGQALIFAEDGQVLDGQHRLTACVLSGISFPALIVWGVEPSDDVMASIDTGSARTRSDVLRIQYGVGDAAVGTACGHIFAYFRQHNFDIAKGRKTPVSPYEVCDIYEKFPEIGETCKETRAIKTVSTGVLAALRTVFRYFDPDAEKDFFEKLSTGVGLEKGHPVLALRKSYEAWALNKGQGGQLRAKMRNATSNVYIMALTVKAWNAFCRGESMNQLRFGTSELFPPVVQDALGVEMYLTARERQREIAGSSVSGKAKINRRYEDRRSFGLTPEGRVSTPSQEVDDDDASYGAVNFFQPA